MLAFLVGCSGQVGQPPSGSGEPEAFRIEPTAVQQRRAHPETITGRFFSVLDFEPREDFTGPVVTSAQPGSSAGPLPQPGHRQMSRLRIEPKGRGFTRHTLAITHTGTGAVEAALRPDAMMTIDLPPLGDARRFTLLSLAVHVYEPRDDLVLTLQDGQDTWTSQPRSLNAGWTIVSIDLASIAGSGSVDLRSLQRLTLTFAQAESMTPFGLDDVLLIDNRRDIPGTPDGLTVQRVGLGYEIAPKGWSEPLKFAPDSDGLHRLGRRQPSLQLMASGFEDGPTSAANKATPFEERLDAMRPRRVGRLELMEINPLRVRLSQAWRFPEPGAAPAVGGHAQVVWEHTFWRNGQWIIDVRIDATGCRPLREARLASSLAMVPAPCPDAGSKDGVIVWRDWSKLVSEASMLVLPPGPEEGEASVATDNYTHPPAMRVLMGSPAPVPGDRNGDGFDESRGCYVVAAKAGRCRVALPADVEGEAYLHVLGAWRSPPSVVCNGRSLANTVPLQDGVLLAVQPSTGAERVVEIVGTPLR